MPVHPSRILRVAFYVIVILSFEVIGCVRACAIPPYLAAFKTYYHVQDGSQVAKAACSNCHTDPPRHNAYGSLVKGALRSANTRTLTSEILQGLDKTVLPGHSKSIEEEINTDNSPGTPKPTVSDAVPLIPKHSMHPALVHFPIALFLFGSFLEALGFYRRTPEIRIAGYWNLLAAAASVPFTLATGLGAFLRIGFALSGNALIHLCLALSSTIAMVAVVAWRKKGPMSGLGYWSLVLLANLLLAATGHFGGLVAGLQ